METQSVSGYILVIGSLGMLAIVSAFILLVYLYQRKMIRKQLAYVQIEKLLQKQELNSAYSLIEGREEERKKIAEDLHDSLGSLLAALRMYSDLLMEQSEEPEVKRLAERMSDLAAQTASEARRISHDLDSGIKNFGLEAAIRKLMDTVRDGQRMEVLTTVDLSENINDKMSLNLYRIVQELVNNTLKHARATLIRLELSCIGHEYISLIFEDNGVGFNPDSATRGLGLRHIQTRVDRFKGTVTIDARPGRGTTCIIEIPQQAENDSHAAGR